MSCRLCDTVKDKEYEELPWLEEGGKPSLITEIIKQLINVAFIGGDTYLYKCPACGQFYISTCWNELFNGWIEFNELRKIRDEEAKEYLEMRIKPIN